ncbi:MAG TPA: hypothetical protein PKA37_14330 [Planctomycetota bacterium]|nr:hypothetical protein [Planctomycetota bacterium]
MVTKNQRRLLVISELVTNGRPEYAPLYSFLDQNGTKLAKSMLSDHYAEIKVLTGAQVTPVNCVKKLEALCKKPGTKAVDMIIQVHGSWVSLWFYGNHHKTIVSFCGMIAARNLRKKLRLCYSLACYGADHNHSWLKAGFTTASGARGVNCNSATDFPAQLFAWGHGEKYDDCVKSGNSEPGLSIADFAGNKMGFGSADSYKLIQGNELLTISSEADD